MNDFDEHIFHIRLNGLRSCSLHNLLHCLVTIWVSSPIPVLITYWSEFPSSPNMLCIKLLFSLSFHCSFSSMVASLTLVPFWHCQSCILSSSILDYEFSGAVCGTVRLVHNLLMHQIITFGPFIVGTRLSQDKVHQLRDISFYRKSKLVASRLSHKHQYVERQM